MPDARTLAPYDAVFVVSYGGPEGPDDVLPFLRNVTRGRNVPEARLAHIARHYDSVGGVSPINARTQELVDALRAEMDRRGLGETPLAWGTRNWRPFTVDGLRPLVESGARRILMLPTAAYACYSSCRQYREDVAAAVSELNAAGDVAVDKTRVFYDSPGFLEANADAIVASLGRLASEGIDPEGTRVLLVTHSIPVAMDAASGEPSDARTRYSAQHEAFAEVLMERVGELVGRPVDDWELTYSCRSGPPTQPWLTPDTEDEIRRAADDGLAAVCLAPIGFIADHMEVVHDLDVEAAEVAADAGLAFARAATAGTHPAFVSGLVNLMEERAALANDLHPTQPSTTPLGPWHVECPDDGCLDHPAI